MEVSEQFYASAALPPGKELPVPIGYEEVTKRKISTLPEIEPRSSEPYPSYCTH
jgi:hypothetical protein